MRLGGIYALERLANDSPDRDYSTIMEVLTAYVRENAPRPQEVISSPASEPSETKTATEPANQELPTPLADIQAILTVLGRRKKAGQAGDVVLDLYQRRIYGEPIWRKPAWIKPACGGQTCGEPTWREPSCGKLVWRGPN